MILSRLMILVGRILPTHKYLVDEIRMLASVTVTATHLRVTDHGASTVLKEIEVGQKEAVDKLRQTPFGFQIDAPEGLALRAKRLYLDLVFEGLNTSEHSNRIKLILYYEKAGNRPYISGIAHLAA